MKKKFLGILFFILLTIISYSKELNIKILDNDIGIPLEGVKIEIKSIDNIFYSNKEGKVKIILSDEINNIILAVNLIGYDSKKVSIKEFDKEVIIRMSIEGVLQGNELIIEEEALGKSDEKVGVSTVMDKDELKSTSESGLIEDVMNTIKKLPGVTFASGYDSRLSIRGAHPDEFTTVYDGFIIRYPYHWGGAYSIFNPNIVETAKFSNGIFSAKHGLAMSGLLEVESVKPNEGLKFETILTSSTFETFIQTPLGKKDMGLLLGGRVTYYDLEVLISDSLKNSRIVQDDGMRFSEAPFIRDGYLKWFWKPTDRFEWYINGFFGSDGVGVSFDSEKSEYVDSDIDTFFDFKWKNYDAFGVTGFKFLPNDKVFIHFLAGYEFFYTGLNGKSNERGERDYSDDFEDDYDSLLGGENGYDLDDHKSDFYDNTIMHGIQTRYDTDIKLHEKVLLSIGAGALFDFLFYETGGKFYSIVYENGYPEYKKISYKIDAEDKRYLKSFLYFEFNFDILPDKLEMDLGCRLDHTIIFSESFENGTMNTIPVPGPRFNIHYTPLRNLKYLDHLTLSAGIGLFTKAPLEETAVSGKYGIKDFDIPMPKVVTNVLGLELEFPYGFLIKLEGYYKNYFNRFYLNVKATDDDDTTKYYINADGIGHAAGFDFMLQRKQSRYIDGWISYSFIFARYFNPNTNDLENEEDMRGEPTGMWFYPSYHRFHNLNVVLNVRPLTWLTLTAELSFATGKPMKDYNTDDIDTFPAVLEDGTIVEMYSIEEEYSDSLRSDFSIPFDFKIAFNFFFPKSKVRFEAYIAVEDLFKIFYTPKKGVNVNKYTGEETPSPEAGYDFAIPIPSLGLKVNF